MNRLVNFFAMSATTLVAFSYLLAPDNLRSDVLGVLFVCFALDLLSIKKKINNSCWY